MHTVLDLFMGKITTNMILVIVVVCGFCMVQGEQDGVRVSLVSFLRTLAAGDEQTVRDLRWDVAVDPCGGQSTGGAAAWTDVTCHDGGVGLIKSITIEGRGLNGTVDAGLLCAAPALRVVSLRDNALRGELPLAISSCTQLTHLYVGGNRLSGGLPSSLSLLRNLKLLNVSSNDFSGELPADLLKISGLQTLLADNNHFNGTIPEFDLTNFNKFNVSSNNLTGPIPEKTGRFGANSFSQNSGLCGQPFFAACPSRPFPTSPGASEQPPTPSTATSEGKKRSREKIVAYLGYILLGAAILLFVAYKLISKKKSKSGTGRIGTNKVADGRKAVPTSTTSATKSDYSLAASGEGQSMAAAPSASLVMLRRSGTALSAAAKELRFEDLLKSPAELLARGRFGSTYKVVLPDGTALAVKRIKDLTVSADEFRRRMERIGRARHANVLPPMAFYCAMQEKLVVYEFQNNGSLSKLLHGSIENSQGSPDWPTRLNIAAKVAEGLAFMHNALQGNDDDDSADDSSIGHGNLKASNILLTSSMDPCISEYGITAMTTASPELLAAGRADNSIFRSDVYRFGMMLLELLTGKAAQNDGADLAKWVNSVIREEWTAEVFDKALLADGASQERMVHLLQVALKCINLTDAGAPSMSQVAGMINAIRDEDERSASSDA